MNNFITFINVDIFILEEKYWFSLCSVNIYLANINYGNNEKKTRSHFDVRPILGLPSGFRWIPYTLHLTSARWKPRKLQTWQICWQALRKSVPYGHILHCYVHSPLNLCKKDFASPSLWKLRLPDFSWSRGSHSNEQSSCILLYSLHGFSTRCGGTKGLLLLCFCYCATAEQMQQIRLGILYFSLHVFMLFQKSNQSSFQTLILFVPI